MSAKIEMIGQVEAKGLLEDILARKDYDLKKGVSYHFQPVKFAGLTGLGKTELAERYAKALDLPMISVPPNAGWGFWRELSNATASIDDENGACSAIPHVIFVDEAHAQKTLNDMFKIVYGRKEAHMTERNGTKNFYDPTQHVVIFASNNKLDPALERRCFKAQLVPYTSKEKKQLLNLFAKKNGQTIENDALDYLETRCKPTAGEVSNLCECLKNVCSDKITLENAQDVCKKNGYFTFGLNKIDLQILMRLEKGQVTTAVLAFIAQSDRKRDTQSIIDWLIALNLVQSSVKSGFMLTDQGNKYLSDIREKQGKVQVELKKPVAKKPVAKKSVVKVSSK